MNKFQNDDIKQINCLKSNQIKKKEHRHVVYDPILSVTQLIKYKGKLHVNNKDH